MAGLGWQELLIILAVALLLFGGTRLAGIGKASGRAIREFKEETQDLRKKPEVTQDAAGDRAVEAPRATGATPADTTTTEVVETEVVHEYDPKPRA